MTKLPHERCSQVGKYSHTLCGGISTVRDDNVIKYASTSGNVCVFVKIKSSTSMHNITKIVNL